MTGILTAGAAGAPFDENEWFKTDIDLRTPEVKQAEEQWLKPPATAYPFPETAIKTMNGIPWPHIDGKPLQLFSRAIMNYQFNGNPVERMLREHGVKVFMLDVDCAQLQPPPGKGFTMVDTTFEKFMKSAESLVKTVPDAKIIVRLWLTNVPPDYVERFPEAVMTGEDGKTDWGRSYGGNGHTRRTNFLDEWRLYVGEFLAKFIEKIGESPYAPQVAGFYLAAMNSGEWWYFKGAGDVGWDYSPGRKELFRRYLALKYGENHVEILKKRWQLDSAEAVYKLPSLAERGQYPIEPGSKVSEYNQVLNLPITSAASYFARIIKAKTNGKALAGMEIHAYLNIFKNNGTIFLNHLLRTPEIDFLGGPPSYDERHAGNYAVERVALNSLQRHGKFWFSEEDIRTHAAYGMVSGAMGQPPLTREGTRNVIRRQFLAAMLKGYPSYLMDFNTNWFRDADIARTVQECNRIFEVLTAHGKLNRKSRIALVSDQESQLYGNYFANPTLNRQNALNRSGLDYDFYELEDFLAPGVADQYRLIFFLNLRALGQAERQGIDALKSGNRTLVFLHDPGAVDLNGQGVDDPALMSKLTGIQLTAAADFLKGPVNWDGGGLQKLAPTAKEIPMTEDSGTGETKLWRQVSLSDAAVGYKTGNVLSRFYGDDPAAVILARNNDGKAVTLFKKYPAWTAVFNTSCLLPVELTRMLAEYAGVPAADNRPDVVFVSGDAVGIHAVSDGIRTVTMPNPGPVVEVFTRKMVSAKQTFDYEFKFGETRLFVTGDLLTELQKLESAEQVALERFKQGNPAPDTAGGFYHWQRIKRPEEFFEQRKIPHADRYGDFPLLVSIPQAYLVADSSIGNPAELREIVRALREGAEPERSRNSATFNRLNESYRLPRQWEAMATDQAFIHLQEMGIGKGQTAFVAFYLVHPENKKVHILFSHTGPAELWVNNRQLELPEEGGETVLNGTVSLVVMKLANPSGEEGFSIKFYEPGTAGARGTTLPNNRAAKDLKIRLAPPGYTMEKQVSVIELPEHWSGNIAFTDGVGEMKKTGSAVNQTKIDIDPDARYKLSASVRGKGDGNWFIGFVQYDAAGRMIGTNEVHFLPDTDTELAKPCSENDLVVYLKNAEKWQKMPNGCIAFETDPALKDLPNRNLSRNGITDIVRDGDCWAVTLAAPAGKAYPAGTPVRQHRAWTQQNFVQSAKIPIDWKDFSGECEGFSSEAPQNKKWWPGAKTFSVILLPNLKEGDRIQFKDIRLEKEVWRGKQ